LVEAAPPVGVRVGGAVGSGGLSRPIVTKSVRT